LTVLWSLAANYEVVEVLSF